MSSLPMEEVQTPPSEAAMQPLSLKSESNSTPASSSSSSTTSQMTIDERFRIVKSVGEECIEDVELENLLSNKPHPICYNGFGPSGRMHIAEGLMTTINVKKMTSAGCKVKIWIADWCAWLNNKMWGDLNKIQTVGLYMIEIWKAVGMDLDGVEFLWSSVEINARASEYWPLVLDIACRNKLPRIMRCSQIMGRNEQDELTAGQILHPCMQCADIIFLKADICQLGMDQREVNVLAREYCDDIKRQNKPIISSHHMLPGLKQGQEKMSNSDPSSCIFMEDEEAEVNVKIKKAYCPEKVVQGNPCLEYLKFIVFPWFNEFKVERNEGNGGDRIFKTFDKLAEEYESGQLHPGDLKPALSKAINKILQPVRDHFKNDANAKDLLKRVKGFKRATAMEEVRTRPSKAMQSLSVNSESNSTPASSSSTTSQMTAKERYKIVKRIGEECIQKDELKNLFSKKPQPSCYDGFEPSGRMHIAQGVMKTNNVNKMTSAGCKVKIWIADWFAQLNNKMGGDLNKIQTVGHYLIEIWKAVGMDLDGDKVDFLWSSEEINARASEYWPLVMDIARRNKLPRIMRCCQIMGRNEQDELTAAQILYPCMQCADIFFLKADICQLGMDQRKVNVLAREYCDDIKRKNKPIILSHHMLPGLKQGQEKMSKSDPSSAIFMEDEEAEVNVKIKEAHCPEKVVQGNPCLDYLKFIVFPWFNEFKVERNEGNGGDRIFTSFEELSEEYESGQLHPGDLKPALSKAINKILQPVRDHFKNDANAKDLLERVKGYRVTR